jgi:hypothetical protein
MHLEKLSSGLGIWFRYIAAISNFTLSTERKLLLKFSAPRRVVSRNKNSYQLETLEGFPIAGKFSSRRLRLFIPRRGTKLDDVQAAIEKEWREREEKEDRVEDNERKNVRDKEDQDDE